MGCMFRSDKMTLVDIYLQPEVAFDVLSHLGEMSCMQINDTLESESEVMHNILTTFYELFMSAVANGLVFCVVVTDMHPEINLFQRRFIQELCRCSELERKLRYIESLMKLHEITIHTSKEAPHAAPVHELVEFEAVVEKWVVDLEQIEENEQNLMKNYFELTEVLYMLKYIGPLLGQAEIPKKPPRDKKAPVPAPGEPVDTGRLYVITGVVNRASAYTFEMMLWRMSRGMIHYRQAHDDTILMDPSTHHEIRKVAFLLVCQGSQLAARVGKVCSGFKVNTYPCPNTYKERMEMTNKLATRVSDLEEVLKKSRYLRCKALRTVSKQWSSWLITVRKSKAIYHQMNNFNLDITRKVLIGQGWVPDVDIEPVKAAIAVCCQAQQTNVESFISAVPVHNLKPPTYHRTNRFTRGFQALVNAYGDSAYRELNPGLYTIISFPFLFGIMFGDVGHGLLMFLFAAWMVWHEVKFLAEETDNEIWNIIFGGRYIILLMGAFSIFSGLCYNDFFGVPFPFFGHSYFKNPYTVEELRRDPLLDIDPRSPSGRVYFIGFDPIWALSKNSIMIQNSMKMKISIILGVIQMIFGVILSIVNYRYFKRTYSIFLQFIPEFIFLVFLFFWLVILIYWKWIQYGAKRVDPELNTACAPQILILFIDMVLLAESKPPHETCKKAYIFDCQRSVQMFLVTVSVIMVPILLFGTPIYKLRKNKQARIKALNKLRNFKSNKDSYDLNDQQYQKRVNELNEEVESYSITFPELMIYQGVHTIEYVLSTISHTASYLRLWALSLAHAQLAHMLFHMVMAKLALKTHSLLGCIKIFPIFAVWAMFTVAILVVMEGLSAFLHTLRLHWVEFMSKFFAGGGSIFYPFCFKRILASSDSDATAAGCKKLMQTHELPR